MVFQRGAVLFSAFALPLGLALAIQGRALDARPVLDDASVLSYSWNPGSFARDVEPVLKKYCVSCHGGVDASGQRVVEMGLDLTTYAAVMRGGTYGTVVEPGDPAGSLLLELMETGEMPVDADPVPAAEIAIIRNWIAAGAPQD